MNSIQILNAEGQDYSDHAYSILSSLGKVTQCHGLNRQSLLADISQYNVLIVRLGNYIDKEIIDAAVNLKVIVTATTGLNHIDVSYANKKKVDILSLRGEYDFLRNISATAEHTIALLLSLLRNIPTAASSIKNNIWDRNLYKGREIDGKTFGILGYGRIGTKVAKYAKAFGANVVAYDLKNINGKQEEIAVASSLDQLFENSDILSVHVPYNDTTHHLINKSNINKMSEASVLINTSRGEIINEMDLLNSLKECSISGAALDVLTNEHLLSPKYPNPLIEYAKQRENLIITPHIGGATYESMHKTEIFMANKLSQWLKSSLNRDLQK